jgi:hypothetical protein
MSARKAPRFITDHAPAVRLTTTGEIFPRTEKRLWLV